MATPLTGELLSSATTFSRTVTAAYAGRMAVGYAVAETDIGKSVTVTATQNSQILAVDYDSTIDNNYDNNDDSTLIMNWATFEVQPGSVDISIDMTAGSANMDGIEIIAPAYPTAVAQTYAAGAHSSPGSCMFNGQLVTVHVEPGTCEHYLFVNRVRVCRLGDDVTAGDKQRNDTYHPTWFCLPVAGGIAVGFGWHNGRSYMRWAATAQGIADATSHPISPSGTNATYMRAAAEDGDATTLYLMQRLGTQAVLTTVTNVTGTPSLSHDYIDPNRGYPRYLAVVPSGSEAIVLAAWQNRDGENWGEFRAAMYRPTDARWYSVYKEGAIGKATIGTSGSPRFVTYTTASYANGGNATLLDNKPGYQRYIPCSTMRLGSFDAASAADTYADVIAVFCDSNGTTSDGAATNLDARLMYMDGSAATRIVTTTTSDDFGLNDTETFRLATSIRWTGDDTLDLFIGGVDGGDHANRIEDSTRDDYFEFGGSGPAGRYAIDLDGVTDSATLSSGISLQNSLDIPAPVRWSLHGVIHGDPLSRVLVEQGDGELHQTGQTGTYQLMDAAATSLSPLSVGGGQLQRLHYGVGLGIGIGI